MAIKTTVGRGFAGKRRVEMRWRSSLKMDFRVDCRDEVPWTTYFGFFLFLFIALEWLPCTGSWLEVYNWGRFHHNGYKIQLEKFTSYGWRWYWSSATETTNLRQRKRLTETKRCQVLNLSSDQRESDVLIVNFLLEVRVTKRIKIIYISKNIRHISFQFLLCLTNDEL